MKTIQLTQGKVALVDDEDFEYLNQFKWCAAKLSGRFYAVRNAPKDGKQYMYMMHRVIMDTPKGFHTDHISGDGLDNRKLNLRIATVQQNGQNRKSCTGTSSEYKGISWQVSRNKWFAQIRKPDGKDEYLGRFTNENEAALAYNAAALRHYGEFARLNVIL